MSAHIGLYFTAGQTLVSPAGVFTNAISRTLRADLNEVSASIELYLEAMPGFRVFDTAVFLQGASASNWRIATTQAGLATATWGAFLNIGLVEHGVLNRRPVFIQARALSTETPVIDTRVTLLVEGLAEPVV